MTFKIVFMDGHVVEQVADEFSIACVMAAYNRFCQGATRASELQINEKKCSRIVPIDPVEFGKSDSSNESFVDEVKYESTKRSLEFSRYLVRMNGHIQELDRITKEQVKTYKCRACGCTVVNPQPADIIAVKAVRYDKMHDTVIHLAQGVLKSDTELCNCSLCRLAKQVLNG